MQAQNAAATGAAYADALDQEVQAQNLEARLDPDNLEPSLREQINSQLDGPLNDAQQRDLNDFLASDLGYEAAERYEEFLEISNMTPAERREAMRALTTEPVMLADLSGALPDGTLDDRSAAQVAADYAERMNETLGDLANSSWAWAAGVAFDAVALAAGGPVKFAVTEVTGHGAAAMLKQGVDAAAEYIAERTELEPDEVAHLAIAGGTIIGGVVLGWSAVKQTVKNLPETVSRIRQSVDNFRRDETGSVPGGRDATNISRTVGPDRGEMDEARIRELGINHEQGGVLDLREGLGAARYETAIGRELSQSDIEGIDFFDGSTPISLKGPLANKVTGDIIEISDEMVDGLANSVIYGAKRNTAARDIVVDTLGLSQQQRARLEKIVRDGLADFHAMPTRITYLE